MKNFIITIDTEGDNLWNWKDGDEIATENVKYLQRFQDLCSDYGFKPVWLSNWEMINDSSFVDFINKNLDKKACELGMHLHAWNTPPYYQLPKNKKSGAPYLIEYPKDIMEQKIAAMTEKMKQRFGFVPASHRAGRWAINEDYLELLYKYGYKIDCSVTPGKSWVSSAGQTPGFSGPDYTCENKNVNIRGKIIEVPVTVEFTHRMFLSMKNSLKSNIKTFLYGIKGKHVWLRPERENINELLWLVEQNSNSESDYLMFMLHSSELMPGGNPIFKTESDIEQLYSSLGILFREISKRYNGITLEKYAVNCVNKNGVLTGLKI